MTRQTIAINLNAKKLLPNLLWVLKAKSTDANRYVLKYLNIDDMGYCCTDGRRLHLCKDKTNLPQGLENGLYEVAVTKDLIIFNPQEGHFPEYKKFIQENKEEKHKLNLYKPTNADLSIAIAEIVIKFSKCINIDFLKDMSGYAWSVSGETEPEKPLQLNNEELLAIIMPLRMETK